MVKHYKKYKMSFSDFNPSVKSWIGHAIHAETLGLRAAIFNNTIFQRAQTGQQPRSINQLKRTR